MCILHNSVDALEKRKIVHIFLSTYSNFFFFEQSLSSDDLSCLLVQILTDS